MNNVKNHDKAIMGSRFKEVTCLYKSGMCSFTRSSKTTAQSGEGPCHQHIGVFACVCE